jgi:asparagine synthase (glutamine-hydrolysing)
MPERYGAWVGYFSREAKASLYTREFRSALNGSSPESWLGGLFTEARGLDPVDASMSVDVDSYLPYDLLVKVDIASMANSLEARSPFLDHKVMEYAARLPVNLKLRGKESKYILKSAFGDLLPRENVERRKMGFGVPVGKWFRTELRELMRDALLSKESVERGYFNGAAVGKMVEDHLSGARDHSATLWNLLMLELWHREFG